MYQISEKHIFNEKEETTSRPWRMTPHLWKLEYNRLNCWGNVQFVVQSLKFIFWYWLLFSNDVIDAHEGHQGINDQLPRGMKSYPTQFSRLPYDKDLWIVHLFDVMHIGKNVTETLWKILDGRRDREKIAKICNAFMSPIMHWKISLNQIEIDIA